MEKPTLSLRAARWSPGTRKDGRHVWKIVKIKSQNVSNLGRYIMYGIFIVSNFNVTFIVSTVTVIIFATGVIYFVASENLPTVPRCSRYCWTSNSRTKSRCTKKKPCVFLQCEIWQLEEDEHWSQDFTDRKLKSCQ